MRCSTSHITALKDPEAFLNQGPKLSNILAQKSKGNGWLIEPFSREFNLTKDSHSLPLFGLTFVVKGNIEVKNLPCTFGLKPPVIPHSDNDSEIVRYFEDRGATLIGVTNLDEGCLTHLGENPHYGAIQNPTNSELRALGTSGGSAAVVAAGLTDFGIGSDYGGSIRAPAAAMGIVGYKTSQGILPSRGSFLYDPEMDTLGIASEKIEDLLFIFGRPPKDHTFKKLLIPPLNCLGNLDKDIAAHFNKTVEQLKNSGVAIETLKENLFEEALYLRKLLAPSHLESVLAKVNFTPPLPKPMLALLALKKKITSIEHTSALQRVREIQESLASWFDEGGALFTPTLPYLPLRTKEEDPRMPFNYFLALANLLGAPAISFPAGKYSLQLVGAKSADFVLLKGALSLCNATKSS